MNTDGWRESLQRDHGHASRFTAYLSVFICGFE
jgi:hypothetical protein